MLVKKELGKDSKGDGVKCENNHTINSGEERQWEEDCGDEIESIQDVVGLVLDY